MIEVVGNYAAADPWPLALEGNSFKTSQTNPKVSQPTKSAIFKQHPNTEKRERKKEIPPDPEKKQQKPKWQASVDQQYLHYLFQEVE